ncbi:MAG: glycosyltransferase family 1 protein [Candidatus Levybacteria bacterium]|nr:glycosyltransferase family 1 protein [Candidatus Levybacteria bacterium]
MRIGIDCRLWNETGVGRYIRSLVKYLQVLDKENEYVLFVQSKDLENIKYQISNIKNKEKWKVVQANVRWHTIKEQLILPWIFKKEKLDLLHFPYFSFPILYPGKFVVTIHDLIFDHYKTGKTSTLPFWFYLIKKIGYHGVLKTSVLRASAILTLSNDAKNEIVEHYKANPDKIHVIYESGALEDVRKEFDSSQFKDIKALKPYLLYVGNAHPHKNVENLVLAMKEIQKENKDLKLVLVGNDKFFYPLLKKYVQIQGLEHKVKIIGEVKNNEIAAWYHFAQCLVTASQMEGFGIPPLEAMSVGTPAIVSDIPVFHEVYGDAAVYFDQNNPKNIADKILETLEDKKKIQELIKKGYKRSEGYSWKKMVEETLKVYNSQL